MADRGASFNVETQRALAELLQQILQLIEENSNQPPEAPTYTPSPIQTQMPSSNVAGMDYNPKTQDLKVQFLGKHPNRNGPIYEYPNINKNMAELLLSGAIPARTDGKNKWGSWYRGKTPSAGASVFTLLKNRNVPFQRLS